MHSQKTDKATKMIITLLSLKQAGTSFKFCFIGIVKQNKLTKFIHRPTRSIPVIIILSGYKFICLNEQHDFKMMPVHTIHYFHLKY